MTEFLFLVLPLWITTVYSATNTTRHHTSRHHYLPTSRIRTTRDPLIDPRDKHHYNPHYGYEPYWSNGAWIIRDPAKDLGPNQFTTKIPLVCGEECNYIYMRVKKVCGHRSDHHYFWSCRWDECYGKDLKDISIRYKTFDTYCEFLAEQCKDKFKRRWALLHVGPCIDKQDKYFKPIVNASIIVTRMWSYLSSYEAVLDHLFDRKTTTRAINMTFVTYKD